MIALKLAVIALIAAGVCALLVFGGKRSRERVERDRATLSTATAVSEIGRVTIQRVTFQIVFIVEAKVLGVEIGRADRAAL